MGRFAAAEESMKIPRWLCLVFVFAAQLRAADPKQPTPTPTPDIRNFTKWSVTYWDGLAGEVKGTAFVNWGDSTARVVLRDPQTNSEKTLVASELKATADDISMTLGGEGLTSERVTAPPNQGASELAAGEGEKVQIEGGIGENQFGVKAKVRADSNITRVALHRGAYGVLTGEWSYYADPITQRNSQGIGRVGWFRLLNRDEIEQLHDVFGPINGGFVGQQSGREQWWPIPLELATVEVVENQLVSDVHGPTFPAPTHEENPYAPYWDDKTRTKWQSETARRRTLFVVGRNFPTSEEKYLGPIFVDGVREFKLIARSKDPSLSQELKQKFELGWSQALANSPKDKRPINREMDAALFEITLNDDVLAGPKKFNWNGEEKEWLLQFGNNRAEARFVRPLREVQGEDSTSVNELEAAQAFYLPERVAVEVQTRVDLPFDHLQVRVGTNRSNDAVKILSARRISPGLYRTDFFYIGPASGGIAAKEGDSLIAAVDQRDLLDNHDFQFVGGVCTKARLLLTPGAREPGKLGGLWKEALLQAAKLAGKENLPLDQLPKTPAEEVSNINVTVGDHAAMLLLREVFVEKMKAQLDWLDGLRTDQDLEKFRDWVEPFLSGDSHAYYAQPQSPYAAVKYPSWLSFMPDSDKNDALKKVDDLNETLGGIGLALKSIPALMYAAAGGDAQKIRWGRGSAFAQIEVTGPDGAAAPFYEAFDQYKNPFEKIFGDNVVARRKWQLDATKEAIGKYREVVNEAKKNAEGILPSDRKELLKLTGIGFSAVIHDLLPRLMRLDETAKPRGLIWVPDRDARSAVCNLATTQQAVLAQRELSDIKYQYALLAAYSVLSVPAMVSDAAVASVVSLAGNFLLWEITSLESLVETYKGRQDVQFEFGYAIVVGPERLAEAELRKSEWFSTLASIVANGAFVALQAAFETMPKIEKEMAVFRGRKICDAKQMRGDVRWFVSLNKDEAGDVMAYLEGGSLRNDSARPMSCEDATKLYKAKSAGREARGPPGPKKSPVVKNSKPGSVPAAEEPKAGFHEAKTEPIPEGPAGEGAAPSGFHKEKTQPITEAPGEEPKVPPEEPQKTANTRVGVFQPPSEPIPEPNLPSTGRPASGSWYCARESGEEVHYLLGKKLGEGGSSEVFLVEEVKGRDKAFMKDGAVIKIILEDSNLGGRKEQIERMWAVNNRLKKTKIKFAEILEAHKDAENPYLIQKVVKFDKDTVMVDMSELTQMSTPYGALLKDYYTEIVLLFPEDKQEAVLQLFQQLAQEDLVATDISLRNIYFERAGNGWVAGILDVDFVVDWREVMDTAQPANKKTVDWVRGIVANPAEEVSMGKGGDKTMYVLRHGITSVLADGRKIATAHDFMEKMLEFLYGGNGRSGYIDYNPVTKQLEARLINPSLIEKYFKNFRKDLSSPPAAAPAPPVKKGGASTVPVRIRLDLFESELVRPDCLTSLALAA